MISDGFAKGKTIQDPGRKNWNTTNGWTGRPKVKVAIVLDTETAVESMMSRMCK